MPAIQQALANAGYTSQAAPSVPAGVLVDSSGNPVKSGSGETMSTGGDQGIFKASGQEVQKPTCPPEFLANTATYSPASNFKAKTPNISTSQAKAMMAELGYFLSQFNYSYASSDGTKIGKYAVDAQYLADAGYIKPDSVKQYGTGTLANSQSWTGKDNIQSQDDFFNNSNIQDTIQYNEFTDSYAALVANGGIKSDDDVCTAAGMMFVVHEYRTADKAKQWRADANSASNQMDPAISGTTMYNHGRYAIDVLSAGGAVASASQAVGLSGPNTSGINPDDVFTFSGQGTGTREAFDQMTGVFKDAILKMAKEFFAKTKSKIVVTSCYRSSAYQDEMYNEWVAAGGPNAPGGRALTKSHGWVTTPAKPGGKPESHGSGMAFDSGQSSLISRTVDLPSYGLQWGGTFSKSDPVHIQLLNWNRSPY
jgi:hypothetical protein